MSSAEQGRQTLKLPVDGDRGLVEKRTYKPCLKNIRKGDVFFYANGKRIDAEFDDAGESLDIIPENADANAEYIVEITCENDCTQYKNDRLLYNLMRFDGENRPKNNWYKGL